MLIMTRKVNEIIDIGDDIEIMVVRIQSDKVRLGIKAPADVKVHRHEVTELIARVARAKLEEEEGE